jgi:hypothetical protein
MPTTTPENLIVLEKAKDWFRARVIEAHRERTKKLQRPSEFNINPFLAPYLSAFLTGDVTAEGIAKALVLSRALGSSISTSFGQNLQTFISEVLGDAYGSIISGIDIEFEDKVDGRKKYAQLKLGPNTINKDDVTTINNHFRDIRNLARTNQVHINATDLVVCIMYGTEQEISSHYKKLRDTLNYPLFIGDDFWHRLTGDPDFFEKLVTAISQTLGEVNSTEEIAQVIAKLATAPKIQDLATIAKNAQTPTVPPVAPPPTTP